MTVLYKCPVCHRLHPIDEFESLDEKTCTDNVTSEKRLFRGIENENRFTQNNWNFNRFDTKKEGYSNDAPLVGISVHNPHPRNVKNW